MTLTSFPTAGLVRSASLSLRFTIARMPLPLPIFRFAAFLLVALPWVAPAPVTAQPAPMLAARAWMLVDGTSGARLAAFEPTARLEPASLTKLMTAYVVFSALNENRI
ncbi:MAG TPA: hypothetical protein VJU53_04590, partial [Burkholderiaceae bacterium]|nr:hypothetical protein [Burkholderiaceae bacterium]